MGDYDQNKVDILTFPETDGLCKSLNMMSKQLSIELTNLGCKIAELEDRIKEIESGRR